MKTRLINIFFVSLVGLILLYPIYLSVFRDLDIPFFDNREIASLPVISKPKDILEAAQQVDLYIADHLPLRNRIVAAWYGFRREILHDTVFSQTFIGKNDWLYYSGYNAVSLYQQVMPFSQGQLEAIRQNLEATRGWLSSRNAQMVVIIVPDKETIYPEFLPGNIPVIGKISQVDQVLNYMRQKSDVHILDLRPVLFARKNAFQIYYKTDTHWNRIGCHAGYEETMREIAKNYPEVQPYPLSDYEVKTAQIPGDLLRFIGWVDKYEIDPLYITQKTPLRARELAGDNYYWSEMMVDDPSLPRLVMFRDSFGACLIPFLAEHFYISLFQWAWAPTNSILVDQSLVENYYPDVVILEITDRYLSLRLLPAGVIQETRP